jgi:hypothetical protein
MAQVTRERHHTAVVLALWTLWPAALGLLALRNGAASATTFLMGSAVAAIGAAVMVVSAHRALQTLGAAILLLVWLPWIVRTIERFSLSFGSRLLAVADSPLAFLTAVLFESLFVAPLPVFAISIWRRRSR